ncbi:hypothetical protein KY310_04130 [Candidatus Woesearchaeota archaeon]|nr:hypothetical protein [Candidatus Woesearchaeota archaeon]
MHKDVVFHKLKKFWRSDVRDHPIKKQIGLSEICFGTLDEVFPGANNQPIIYSGNLKHVLDATRWEGRNLDVLAGICMFGYSRINAENASSKFDLWVLPKELDKGSDWKLKDFASPPRGWEKWPLVLDTSAAYLEPTFGRVAKILNIFEVARQFSDKVTFMLPTEEYYLVRHAVGKKIGFRAADLRKLRTVHEEAAERYAQAIQKIQGKYFPGVSAEVLSSSQDDIRKGIDSITKDIDYREVLCSLKRFSYHQKVNASEECLEEERRYLALLITKNARILDESSRVIILNARDIDSFLLQAMYVYTLFNPAKVLDRIAFVGVGGGPAVTRRIRPDGLVCPLEMQDASYDDYFGLAPTQVISPAESIEDIEAKLNFPHAERSNTSPIFAYLNVFGEYLQRDASLLERWKNGKANEEQAKKSLLSILSELKTNLA